MLLSRQRKKIKNISVGDMVRINKSISLVDQGLNIVEIKSGTIGMITNKVCSDLQENLEDEICLFIKNNYFKGLSLYDPNIEIVGKE